MGLDSDYRQKEVRRMGQEERIFILTEKQFTALHDHMERSFQAMSDEEIAALLVEEVDLRDMLRQIKQDQDPK